MEFRDPPPPIKGGPRKRVFTPEVIQALRENPGKWAYVGTSSGPPVAYYQSRPELEGMEFTTRRDHSKPKPKQIDLYARYNPPEEG